MPGMLPHDKGGMFDQWLLGVHHYGILQVCRLPERYFLQDSYVISNLRGANRSRPALLQCALE